MLTFKLCIENAFNKRSFIKTIPANSEVSGKPDIFTDPLEWWKLRCVEFPHIAKVARKVLCIPASSAPSERVFSAAGLTISNLRAGLLPENASALVVLNQSWSVVEELR